MQPEPVEIRLWRKVRKTPECWNWEGYRQPDGYGMIRNGKNMQLTHRVSFEISNGEIPKGLYVLHHCDNPACVNPKHLFLGTQQDNVDDCRKKGRLAVGERRAKGKLTAANVKEIRSSTASQRILAKQYGVHNSIISLVVNRKSWKHVQ